MFTLRFWGVRGSIATADKRKIKYGGNTACLEIRAGKRLLIIDCGTGFPPLGEALLAEYGKNPITADVFLTHTHLDHIVGIMMFNPFFSSENTFFMHAPRSVSGKTAKNVLFGLSNKDVWPVSVDQLAANLKWKSIDETVLDLGDGIIVRTFFLHHHCPCLGYRFEFEGKAITVAFDNEISLADENKKLMAFIKNSDIAILDTTYTAKEYETRQGWGHSSYEATINCAEKAGVKTLYFIHYNNLHTDDEIAALETKFSNASKKMKIIAAREGVLVKLN